jgi:hypothetical protein
LTPAATTHHRGFWWFRVLTCVFSRIRLGCLTGAAAAGQTALVLTIDVSNGIDPAQRAEMNIPCGCGKFWS